MQKLFLILGMLLAPITAFADGPGSPGPVYWDGLTATKAELSFVHGVTSNIQTQLDGKSPQAITASRAAVSDTNGVVVAATTTAAEIGYVNGVTSAIQTQLDAKATIATTVKFAKVALAAVRTAGGVLGWTNPTGGSIIVTNLVLDVTTPSSGASTIDCGIGTNSTTSSDTLIDGASGTPAEVLDDVKNAGTNGASATKATSTQAVTCSEASGDVTGIAGFAYIYYHAL